jgi:hypothetical protein
MAPEVTLLHSFELVDVMSRVYTFYAKHKRDNVRNCLHETCKSINNNHRNVKEIFLCH